MADNLVDGGTGNSSGHAMVPIELRALVVEADLALLVDLQRRHASRHRQWDLDKARLQLADFGRAGGANVVVAWRAGAPVGVAGWVALAASEGEFYGAPVIAGEVEVAELLIDRVEHEAVAAGASWVRMSAWPEDDAKARVLAQHDYRHLFDFVELAADIATPQPHSSAALRGLQRVAVAEVDAADYADIFNECFRDVPNSPRFSAETAATSLSEQPPLAEASQFWADDDGVYQAFSITLPSGYVESFGVRDGYQRRGIACAMLAETMASARRCGLERLTSTVASTNLGSLRVHELLGFNEVERCEVWQRELAAR